MLPATTTQPRGACLPDRDISQLTLTRAHISSRSAGARGSNSHLPVSICAAKAGMLRVSLCDIYHRVKAEQLHDTFAALWNITEGLDSSCVSFPHVVLLSGERAGHLSCGWLPFACLQAGFARSVVRETRRSPRSDESTDPLQWDSPLRYSHRKMPLLRGKPSGLKALQRCVAAG